MKHKIWETIETKTNCFCQFHLDVRHNTKEKICRNSINIFQINSHRISGGLTMFSCIFNLDLNFPLRLYS